MPVLGLLQHFNSRPCLVLIRTDMVVVSWNVIVFSNNSSVYWNASFVHPWSSHKCNRITESVMSSPSRSLCYFWQFDHNILITRLSSWFFGIHGSVLSWFTSHLSSRCFRVKCDNNLSSWYTSSCGVPKVLFSVLYTSLHTSLLRVLSFLPVP